MKLIWNVILWLLEVIVLSWFITIITLVLYPVVLWMVNLTIYIASIIWTTVTNLFKRPAKVKQN